MTRRPHHRAWPGRQNIARRRGEGEGSMPGHPRQSPYRRKHPSVSLSSSSSSSLPPHQSAEQQNPPPSPHSGRTTLPSLPTGDVEQIVRQAWIDKDGTNPPCDATALACPSERVKELNGRPPRLNGRYVLLWVQQDCRVSCNHALEYASAQANKLGVPVVACYGLWTRFPDANARMFSFLLDGLVDLHRRLRDERRIEFVVLLAPPPKAVAFLEPAASTIVCDCGYTRICKSWRRAVADSAGCRVTQVETNVVIPVERASSSAEPAARTLRPKLTRLASRFLRPMHPFVVTRPSTGMCEELGLPLPASHKNHALSRASLTGPAAAVTVTGEKIPRKGQFAFDDPIQRIDLERASSGTDILECLCEQGLIDDSVPPVHGAHGGETQALMHLIRFLHFDKSSPSPACAQASSRPLTALGGLWQYGNGKLNNPAQSNTSGLSAYLHFGQLSPVHVALAVRAVAAVKTQMDDSPMRRGAGAPMSPKSHQKCNGDGSNPNTNSTNGSYTRSTSQSLRGATSPEAFLEEVIVRRELARNFVHFKPDCYDTIDSLPSWASETLSDHASDPRPAPLSLNQLARGETDDPWWNAAQWEMVATGYMHNYMRMYWCKSLLRWCQNAEEAFQAAVKLNNRFELDGRDENAYMGIAWCFGHHDQPFPARPLFGQVRSMTRGGLEGKFDMPAYAARVKTAVIQALSTTPSLARLLPKSATAAVGGRSTTNEGGGGGKRKRRDGSNFRENGTTQDIRALFSTAGHRKKK